jgi:hypothetical protein
MRQGPFLELSIRGERENRKIGYAVFYEDLIYQFRSRSPAEVLASSGCTRFRPTTQSVLGARGLREELFRGARDLIVSSRSVCHPGRDHLRQHDRRLATEPEIEEPRRHSKIYGPGRSTFSRRTIEFPDAG